MTWMSTARMQGLRMMMTRMMSLRRRRRVMMRTLGRLAREVGGKRGAACA
jgi:hypothetical protein